MDIKLEEIITELDKQFPKELLICVQAVTIRKLQEQQEHTHEPETDSAISN